MPSRIKYLPFANFHLPYIDRLLNLKIANRWKMVDGKWKIQSGFTLVEILLFLLVIFALSAILLSGAGIISKNLGVNLQSVAAGIANCEIERIRDLDFTDPDFPANGPPTAIGAPCNVDLSKLPNPDSANRTLSDYSGDPDIKQVTIVVSWTKSGVTDSIQTDTLISKYGP